jgi:hypothetical protein
MTNACVLIKAVAWPRLRLGGCPATQQLSIRTIQYRHNRPTTITTDPSLAGRELLLLCFLLDHLLSVEAQLACRNKSLQDPIHYCRD